MNADSFQRRTNIIAWCFVAVGILAAGRLFYLQVIRHNYYTVLASAEQRRKYEVPSNRGKIYMNDRGKAIPVVLNRDLKTLYADPRYVLDKADTAKRLAQVTGEDVKSYEDKLNSQSFYVVLKKQVEPAQAAAIDKLELAGIGLNDTPARVYPEGILGSQVLGFVNNDGNGQYGIEEYLNDKLAGSKGLLNAKTDTRGIPIATSDNVQLRPVDGGDVVLTIDRNIQAKTEQVITEGASKYKSKAVSAVVLDPSSGRILAMANYPGFDASRYQEVSDYSVFSNRAATGLYEPGSVMKVFAMAAGLETKSIAPTTPFTNTGSTQVADYTIKNAQGIANGQLSMSEVLSKSVNTGMVQVLRALGGGEINNAGKTKLYEFYTGRFKFGEATGADVPAEPGGQIFPPSENNVTYANMSFGQGMTATMLQVATGYAAIFNGGTLYKPYIIEQITAPDGKVERTVPQAKASGILSQATIDQLKPMLEAVVQSGGGTALKTPGYHIGGKTGTAQIPNPAGGYFENRDIGSFVGVEPLNNPRYIIMVRIDEPVVGGFAGSAAAAPMVGEIGKWLLNYGGVAPSG